MTAKLLDLKTGGRQFVDRYELVGEIASGGMATVFLARLTGVGGFQRMYAVKRLHPHLQHEKEFVEMFLDEARLAAGIHHPNVVPILEVGASENAYYLVMEYIEGDTLARLLARAASNKQRLPTGEVMRIAVDTLSGLHAAHELKDETGALAGVVHRDVSPQNVLVGVDGISRITDFGVARAATRLSATRVGQLKGKIAYMAPEQARGDEDLDRRADVFAAGVVFWEALAHRRLFKAQNEAATLSRVLHDPLPDLKEAAPHLSAGVCQVIMKALERDRDKRIRTCAEFADLLERASQASGELGSPRDVQSYMDKVMGQDIRLAREAVRVWTSQADSAVGPAPVMTPSRGTSTPGVETLGRLEGTYPAPKRRMWIPVAALVALGLVGFLGHQLYLAKTAQNLPSAVSAPAPTAPPVPAPPAPETAPTLPLEPKEGTDSAVSLEEVTEPVETPRPSPAPARAPAPAPATSKGPSPSPSPAPTPSPKKNPLDALDSNPYR